MNAKKQQQSCAGALVLAIVAALSLGPIPAAAQAVNARISPNVQAPPGGCPFSLAVGSGSTRLDSKRSWVAGEAANVIGHTPEEIRQRFAAIQEMNFSSGNAKLIISRLSDKELRSIAVHYNKSAPAGDNTLLRILASRLDAKSLVRVANAFGTARVDAVVESFAPAAVQRTFTQEIEMRPMMLPPPGDGGGDGGGGAPSVSQSQEEIYLDFRSATTGSASPSAAITETSVFDGLNLISLGQDAYWAGTQIHNLIEYFDPRPI